SCLLCMCVLLPAILFPVFSQAREEARKTACLTNLKQLALAQEMYANDHDGRYPAAARWGDLTRLYVANPETYRCPSVPQERGFGYAMNVRLSRQKLDAIQDPSQTPLLYDSSNLAWNAHDPFTSLPNPPRHGREVNNIAFADGHSKSVRSP
ncbi:MAG: DUF1559 domain-containing protein, partial [Fimbriimonadales bacterium]|nr:DUF1559 domain-containing protein [Fimbriimonadales bacterium]